MARNALKNIYRLIEAETASLPVEQEFLEDLKRSIEMDAKATSRKPSQTYKPSSMNCIRNMWYQVTGADQDEGTPNYSVIGICNSGSDIHERIQQSVIDMKSNNMDCEYINVADFVKSRNLDYLDIVQEPDFENGGFETKLYHKELNMSFLCDGIIKYKNHYYILEIKTESSYKAMNRKGVDPSHYNQGTAYSIAFGLPEVMFIYINRDIFDMKSFLFVPTDDMKNDLIGRITECDRYVSLNELPPIPEDVTKKDCSYCAYRNRCRG